MASINAGAFLNTNPLLYTNIKNSIGGAPSPAGWHGLALALSEKYSQIDGNTIRYFQRTNDAYASTEALLSFCDSICVSIPDMVDALLKSNNTTAAEMFRKALRGETVDYKAPVFNPHPAPFFNGSLSLSSFNTQPTPTTLASSLSSSTMMHNDEGIEVPDEDEIKMPSFFIVEDTHSILHVKGGIDTQKKGEKALEAYAKIYSKKMALYESIDEISAETPGVELEDGIAIAIDDEEDNDSDESPKVRELHLKDDKPATSKGVTVSYGGKKVGKNGLISPFNILIIAQRPEYSNNTQKYQVITAEGDKGDKIPFKDIDEAKETASNLASENSSHQFGVYVCIKRRKVKEANVVIKNKTKVVLPAKPKQISSSKVSKE